MDESEALPGQALDNSVVIDFLTTTAGVLHQEGFLVKKDADSLRISLSGIHDHPEGRQGPLIPALVRQKSEFISLLTARYGVSRLGSNLLRYTTRPPLHRVIQSLSRWGMRLLPLAEQSFNRPFYVYQGQNCESRTLYSAVLIHLAGVIEQTGLQLWEAEESGRYFFPHGMISGQDSDLNLDQAVGGALGFKDITFAPFPGVGDRSMGHKISQAVEHLCLALEELVLNMDQDAPDLEPVPGVQMLTESLLRDTGSLIPACPRYSGLVAWDMRRRMVVAALNRLASGINRLAEETVVLVREHQKKAFGAEVSVDGGDLRRRISSQIISGGVGARHADRATKDLFEYMHKNAVKPQELILGELNKINMALTPKSLEILRDFCQNEKIAKAPAMEKKKILRECRHLRKEFDRQLAQLGKLLVVLLAVMFSGACGLKTAPKSPEPDLRPDIPYREGAYGFQYFSQETGEKPGQIKERPVGGKKKGNSTTDEARRDAAEAVKEEKHPTEEQRNYEQENR